jgi:YidC/Oxa1 family membrane protein insertase
VIAIAVWQSLLNGLGWCMAQVYNVVPNYAVTIIIVTVVIRLLVLPFGFKQIKSMQHMQALQPKIKDLQKRYKNNKQKQQEETMKLYKEAGVNPLGGCLPMLLTLPFLFAMYAVIRPPVLAPNAAQTVAVTSAAITSGSTAQFGVAEPLTLSAGDVVVVSNVTPGDYDGEWTVSSATATSFQADIGADPAKPPAAATAFGTAGERDSYVPMNNHLPTSSTLFYDVITHQNLEMLSVNLQCALATSGTAVQEKDSERQQIQQDLPILGPGSQAIASDPTAQATLDCGTKKIPDAIPYVLLLLLMLGTAIYQQRQMTKANPPAANAGPNAAMLKYMPLLYGVWGYAFPAGLIVYWTTANGIQIAQQTVMLRAGHIGPEALERRMAEQRAKMAENDGKPKRRGLMTILNEKAEQAQRQQDTPKQPPRTKGGSSTAKGKASSKRGGSASNSSRQDQRKNNSARQNPPRKPSKGAAPGNQLKPKNREPEGEDTHG